MKKLALFLFLCSSFAASQVVLITPPRFQSLLQNGAPNAFGCVWTYQSGTSTPLGSFTDYTGVTSNPDPVPLDAGGFANIWLTSGSLYRIVIKTSGGTNCSAGSTLSTTDGVNQSLLNLSNIWQQPQIFEDPIQILAPDLQIVFGSPSGSQTTLDIPPTTGNYILHGPPLTGSDTLVSQNAIQPLSNKNLTSGTQINGCAVVNGPATYICIANNTSTATLANGLAVLTGAPSTATVAPLSQQTGITGVVVSGAGITGNAVIQQSGTVSCNFDGATTAGDFIQNSTTILGDCEDAGPGYGGLGTVLSTNSGAGLYQVLLRPSVGSQTIYADGNPVTVNTNTTADQIVKTASFGAGTLNVAGKYFRVQYNLTVAPAGATTNTIYLGYGASSSLGFYQALVSESSSSTTFGANLIISCVVETPGSSGLINCSANVGNSGGAITLTTIAFDLPVDLTQALFVGPACSFSGASTSNSCTNQEFTLEQLN